MRYIVTGGAGFIGSNLVDKLIEDGHEVIVFDNISSGKVENINPKAKFMEVDISEDYFDEYFWSRECFDGVDTVFHTAAKARVQPSITDPISFNKTNVDGTLNLLKMAVDSKVRRFVYSASSSAYGNTNVFPTNEKVSTNPLSPYGAQKLMGEI